MQADFYQLAATNQSTLEIALPKILTKARAAGHEIAVLAPTPTLAQRLDEGLWRTPAEGFLPHAVFNPEGQNNAPILIYTPENLRAITTQNASVVVNVFGGLKTFASQDFSLINTPKVTRILDIFTSQETQISTARERWKTLKAQTLPLRYFAEIEKGWTQKQ